MFLFGTMRGDAQSKSLLLLVFKKAVLFYAYRNVIPSSSNKNAR